jgi:hypothetical protein
MKRTKMALEVSGFYLHLTWVIAREDFIGFSGRDRYKSYNTETNEKNYSKRRKKEEKAHMKK